jgi:hypothetical protein
MEFSFHDAGILHFFNTSTCEGEAIFLSLSLVIHFEYYISIIGDAQWAAAYAWLDRHSLNMYIITGRTSAFQILCFDSGVF